MREYALNKSIYYLAEYGWIYVLVMRSDLAPQPAPTSTAKHIAIDSICNGKSIVACSRHTKIAISAPRI